MADFLAITTVIGYGLAMEKILISACLMGQPVRYDGATKPTRNPHLARWQLAGRLLAFCPEIAGGFSTPRLPAEIEPDATAKDVLQGDARILDSHGANVTQGFLLGARATLAAAKNAGCRHAILMDRSPSCGATRIYDGHFNGTLKSGIGVTALLLANHGIRVWSEDAIDALAAILTSQ